MDINKAIRKQNKSYKRFMLSMCFIFFILPFALLIANKFDVFFLTYLAIIELLILTTIVITINAGYLKYDYDNYKIKIKQGLFKVEFNLVCNKVVLVHTEGDGTQFNIILLTTSRFRNKKIKLIDQEFLKNNSYVAHHYYKLKKQHPEEEYYYFIITKGGFIKYKLLDTIYKSCVSAVYTEEAIEKIKEFRS